MRIEKVASKVNKHRLIYEKLTYLINGVCFDAHNQLGRYSREKQYGNYIQKRLKEEGLRFERELVVGDSGNTLDFVIDDKIVLELKAKKFLTKSDYYQVQRYLHITGLKLGILVNFRDERIKPRRIIRVDRTR